MRKLLKTVMRALIILCLLSVAVNSMWTKSVEAVGDAIKALALMCSPRPPVTVTVTGDSGGLLVLATATAPAGQDNRLQQLRFGPTSNALIDIGSQTGQSGAFVVNLPDGTRQAAFKVWRATDNGTATVPLVIVDDCGEWRTFV